MSESESLFDVVIIGAGMAGASLVHMLLPAMQAGMKVALLDRQQIAWDAEAHTRPPSFDGRATALAWGSRLLLEQMGCWDALAERACAIEHIQVSDRGRFGQTHLHHHEQGTVALGYIVENAVLGRALLQQLGSFEGLTLLPETDVTSVKMTTEGSCLTLADGTVLHSRLLVMADGARSGLAEQLGIRHIRKDYGSHAIVTQVEMDRDHGHWAYERFSDHGPVAFLPLHQRHFAVVWTLDPERADAMLNAPDEVFMQQLQSQIGYRCGRIQRVGSRQSYPLALVRSTEQVRRGLVLLGNAAHSLHPVAGQGFNLALRDTAALAERLLDSWFAARPLGDIATLSRYLEHQQGDQSNTVVASDLLPRIFAGQGHLVAAGRAFGLLGLATLTMPRRLLTLHAMGLGQRAARLGTRKQEKIDAV
ncbi:2-octaprenyl-6-methoxyphenyl hydroxylase [Oceanobacter mangrovi]|uniref:2-octaprenyl-6-methoxyphenyl hydroxylase n=1 Tax=Oceanobacter mangrovi TaxID=2862510 RepID=UPI001C8CF9EC|nr:2-octaprenyl-6-methoxyphenyl hydroxylase [Oceanobacter mangrovi]